MVLTAVSLVSSFEADDDTLNLVGVGREKQNKNKTKQKTRLRYAILTQFDIE